MAVDKARLGEVLDGIKPIVEGYMENRHTFAHVDDLIKMSNDHFMGIFKKGGHRKINGKKMREKFKYAKFIKHLKHHRTYVISVPHLMKDGILVEVILINYFSCAGGMIYALRCARVRGGREVVYLFTSHFFDRLAERGYGSDPLNRSWVVQEFLYDFAMAQMNLGFALFNNETCSAKMYLGHGVGVGEYIPIPDTPAMDPRGYDDREPVEGKVLMLVKMVTYLGLEMIHPDLLALFQKGGGYIDQHPEELEAVLHHV